ncbi:ABC transporter ATP-binding protein [Romeria aff. gracilis LEGE 07310]|uniref:ABC transporter ATP-binding protein n=1 Tax=Vasconcelosia minhoensis LEGE 07310 TaxID=915328 RepID=A0A8J7APC6_9CYAN|nr:ABC transporter ATP-binding protein [Romeria gracilis]MBE9077791.1 ABC transporter ATP-binding protein [Romeria aff. gracilis LEGE 07310]
MTEQLSLATSPQVETAAVLEFRDVGLQYRMSGRPMPVIEHISLSVGEAEFVSIVGPSGCGKTSLLRMISGLNPVGKGQVCFRGEPITKPLSSVGIAFQNPVLLPWRTTLQNVLLPLEVVPTHRRQLKNQRSRYETMAQDLLATVGLEDFQHHYPRQLSGGMKQRASLCRALIHQPELLLLDEPFAALDAFTREEMWELLQRLWARSQCTSVLVTHNLREAIFLSDTVYVMGPRPSQMVYTLKVDLPRPRTLDMCFTEDFHQMYTELRQHIQRK